MMINQKKNRQAVFQVLIEPCTSKTRAQLESLEQRIKSKIENKNDIVVGYWESSLFELQAYMAQSRLNDRHQSTLKRKLQKIKQEPQIFHAPISTSSKTSSTCTNTNEDDWIKADPEDFYNV